MGDEDLYVGDVRNYYNTQRRERRAKAIRRRKGRL